ncbi:MAG TPA: hypothetical protein VJL29_01315, partial [Thermoguttaceae bacterium]|nr:hypothetical protein [Thermoguttaceae bacterium]
GPTNAADQIKRGDELRALAANKKEPVGVSRGLELEAAEWYLRALQTSKGLRRLLAEKRLGDMEEAIVGKRTVRADDVETLMGTWEIEATNGYHGFWTFFADGTVLSLATPNAEKGLGGVWSVEQKDIKIIWDKKGWNTFHRPLSVRETRGDSWLGVGIITAKKLADRQGRFGNDVPDAAEDIRALIGTWKVTAGKWQAFWTFFEDGTVLRSSTLDPLTGPRGVWNIGPTYVKITWNEKAWETFPRPLDVNETHGDSWAGKGYVRAKKLNNRNGRLNGVGIIGAQKFADQGHLASRTLDSAKDVGVLIGKWEVQVKSGDYSNFRIFWTFFEDGTIIRARTQEAQSGPRGVWNVESKCVKITWDKIAWETFYRPLDVNETHGDSWKGMGILKAKKVD